MFLCLVLLLAFLSCTKQTMMSGEGVLKGKISIGPLCPVETIPPLPQCLPTRDTYNAWATAVWTTDKTRKITTIIPNLDGTYMVDLPSGNYIVDFASVQTNRFGAGNLPALITIDDKDTTKLDISIDTGIR
ncbi:MAG: hypothetical protein Q8908_03420 [Bacteroidota bacterium]|nr:hypothetical protein [Bacteroidota bacterium]